MSLVLETAPPIHRRADPTTARILMFDSGLGGLTVLAATRTLLPGAEVTYLADDAVFPYGRLDEPTLVARVVEVMERVIPRLDPHAVVIACNTASTLVLKPLRARWPALPFVGTVPAIKPAAAASRSKHISVLATPGTAARDYTRDLVRSFADGCEVTLVGAPQLASLAEAAMRGEPVPDGDVAREIAPAFVARDGRRTDTVVLACTHYPLLMPVFERLAPWPVLYVDPAPAIARRASAVLADAGVALDAEAPALPFTAVFTSDRVPAGSLRTALEARGLGRIARF